MMKAVKWLILLSLCLFLFSACTKAEASSDETKKEKPVPVEIACSQRGSIESVYSGSTALEAENEAAVVAKVNGIVEKIMVEEGDRVRAGTVLAQIEAEQYRLRAEQARASMVKLEKEYERSRSLHADNIVSKESFDRIRYDYENQKAAYDLAHYELTQTRITAPIDGVVTLRRIKTGNQIQTGQQLFHIADFSPILGVLFVPEKELDKMKTGQKATLVADVLPDIVFQGFIKLINPVINAQTGTVKVTLEIHDQDARLKPGMFVRAHIVTDVHEKALLIPRDSLISEDTEQYVFTTEEKDGVIRAKKQTVKLGYANPQNVEITEGLEENARVVTIGHSTLKDGSRIEVIRDEKNH
jgi:RND family efflux transporter MFP subunit